MATLPYHPAPAQAPKNPRQKDKIRGFGVELAVPTIIGADALDW